MAFFETGSILPYRKRIPAVGNQNGGYGVL